MYMPLMVENDGLDLAEENGGQELAIWGISAGQLTLKPAAALEATL